MESIIKWLRKLYNKSIHSIAFYPALISLGILVLFIMIYDAESSAAAKALKSSFVWMNLKHAEAARTIITTITAGIIGLTVFSFSMVMVVMSQAASQMTNRILDNLIGNKFQQFTLGFYLGTILSSFFLLTVVDDKGSPQVPSLSVFILVLLTVVDLFLFVSFLHYVTQSVRFEYLIKRIHQKTIDSLMNAKSKTSPGHWALQYSEYLEVLSPQSNYFQGINTRQLVKYSWENKIQIEFYPVRCTYITKGQPLLKIYFESMPDETRVKKLFESIDFYTAQEIDKNPFYGFAHLTEVAIKALSPGINDPNTAVLCINSLTDLLIIKMKDSAVNVFSDKHDTPRIFLKDHSFGFLFNYCIYPIWDYGKRDRFIIMALKRAMEYLRNADNDRLYVTIIKEFESALEGEKMVVE